MSSSSRLFLNVSVEFSKKTQSIKEEIEYKKSIIAFLNQKNRFFKELCFLGGEIQSEAQKELNINNIEITTSIKSLLELKKRFSVEYENDYKIAYEKALNQKQRLNSNNDYVNNISRTSLETIDKKHTVKHPDVVILERIISEAKSISYDFTPKIMSAIVKRIEKLS